jgi:hypothetical protein
MAEVEHEITELLRAWRSGDETALEKLTPRVYRELHRAATRCMKSERDDHTLQTTALINELYLWLKALQGIDWQNRFWRSATCSTAAAWGNGAGLWNGHSPGSISSVVFVCVMKSEQIYTQHFCRSPVS